MIDEMLLETERDRKYIMNRVKNIAAGYATLETSEGITQGGDTITSKISDVGKVHLIKNKIPNEFGKLVGAYTILLQDKLDRVALEKLELYGEDVKEKYLKEKSLKVLDKVELSSTNFEYSNKASTLGFILVIISFFIPTSINKTQVSFKIIYIVIAFIIYKIVKMDEEGNANQSIRDYFDKLESALERYTEDYCYTYEKNMMRILERIEN